MSFLMKNMSGVRYEIQWCPAHPDKFITWGTEIYLYEVTPLKDAKSSCLKISETTGANLLASNSNHHYVKCIDIYPQQEPDVLLALGQANGKIALATFGQSYDSQGLTGKELVPKHARQCNAVAWNPVESNFIAAGLEKYRADHSVLLWDVSQCPHHPSNQHTAYELSKPIAELALSETAHSLAWFSTQPRSLVVGINNKHLKLVDLRDSNKIVNATPTKAVYGLVVDQHNDRQLASYNDNQIAIWDTRYFEKPLLTLSQSRNVAKVLWCPTRHNLLGSLLRDSSAINLHDIQHTLVGNDEIEPSVLERTVQPGSTNQVTSFSWHATHENRLLTIAQSDIITDYVVFERMTFNWSSSSHLVWTFGRRTLKLISDRDSIYDNFEDISITMRRRALNNYGLRPQLADNGTISEDVALCNLWRWLHTSQNFAECRKSVAEEGKTERPVVCGAPGVRCVVRINSDTSSDVMACSDVVTLPWTDLNGMTTKIYRSEDRDKALLLCGWNFENDSFSLSAFLEPLEAQGMFSRAAAIAVFNLKLRLAMDVLNRGHQVESAKGDSNLNIVAMALSGFSEAATGMWRDLCVSSRSKLSDPYLRAMFAFLTADTDIYENVLNETGMAVEDRVAFACIFLSDVKLAEYLNQLTFQLTEDGDLAGILLTGTTKEGIDILDRYLQITGDVQSVSLLAIRAWPEDLHHENTVKVWVSGYRNLLDAWRLWTQRARLDIAHSSGDRPPQQVFVSCNFCGKSVSAQMLAAARNRSGFRLGAAAQKLKMSSCPQCRKPLPRCAICLVHMGTASGHSTSQTSSIGRSSGEKLAEYASWFTWCQTCRHGGHASHMTQWFKEHTECPVTACTCCCLSKDAASKVKSVTAQQAIRQT